MSRRQIRLPFLLAMTFAMLGLGSLLVFVPYIAAAPVSPQDETPIAGSIYQEGDARLVLSGTWQIVADESALGDAYLASDEADTQVSLIFTGTSVHLYRHLAPTGGFAQISIDNGAYIRDVSFYRGDLRPQSPFVMDQLEAGSHTLTLTVSPPWEHNGVVSTVKLDALVVPSMTITNSIQALALDRANHFRELLGLPQMVGRDAIHFGTMAHAEYLAINRAHPSMEGLGAHYEQSELPGYVGRIPTERGEYFGYQEGLSEIIAFVGDPVASIDAWLETVYHRDPLLCYACVFGGYGMVNDERGKYDVFNIGKHPNLQPAYRLIYTFPQNGQSDVPTMWDGGEIPDPLPDNSDYVGYPISLYIAQPPLLSAAAHPADEQSALIYDFLSQPFLSPDWLLTKGELRDEEGQIVPTYLLDQASDPNHVLPADELFLIPKQPLEFGKQYAVEASGTDSRGDPFSHSWSFTTESGTLPYALDTEIGACQATVLWKTNQSLTSSMRLGVNPNTYTQEIQAKIIYAPDFGPVSYRANLPGLTPDTRYYYQIVGQDEDGQDHPATSGTFTTSTPQTFAISSNDSSALYNALDDAQPCDTVTVTAGTYNGGFVLPFGVNLLGEGAHRTILQATEGSVLEAYGKNVISGFTIQGSGTSDSDAGIFFKDDPTAILHDLRVQNNENGIMVPCFESSCSGQFSLLNSVLAHNRSQALYLGDGITNAQIINNTLVGNRWGIFNRSHAVNIRNNIIVQHEVYGIGAQQESSAPTILYNNLWSNAFDDQAALTGTGTLTLDPAFVDGANGNYALLQDSPMINAGDPDPRYQDANGTRNDLGATGGSGNDANLAILEIMSTPRNPAPGEIVHYTVRLYSGGRPVEDVELQLTVPPALRVLVEAPQVSQGTAQWQDATLTWTAGTAYYGVPLELHFGVEVEPSLSTPASLSIAATMTWQGGQHSQQHNIVVGGSVLFVPHAGK